MSTPSRPADLLHEALDALTTIYTDPRYTPHVTVLPSRRHIHSGDFAIDCESVIAAADQLPPGLAAAPDFNEGGCLTPTILTFTLAIIRCVPVPDSSGNAPSPAALTASAEELTADGWMLTVGLQRAHMEGVFLPGCHNLTRTAGAPIGPGGGFGGWTSTWITDVNS